VKRFGARADVWYKERSHAMTARLNTSSTAFADTGRYAYAFSYRAWRFS
jgi:hypothetical protein